MTRPRYTLFMTALLVTLGFNLSGCSSYSLKSANALDANHPKYDSQECQGALAQVDVHESVKLARTLASPLLILASGGTLAVPVLASNVGLDTMDNVNASKLSAVCGGRAKSNQLIASEVAAGAAVGLVTGGMKVGAVTTATK
jgi:hypothetical protein